MNAISDELQRLCNYGGEIVRSQATFVDIRTTTPHPESWRIRFRRALRRSRLRGPFERLSFHDQHPLCLPHKGDWGDVAIHSRPANPSRLLDRLSQSASALFDDWLHLNEFLNPCFATEAAFPRQGRLMAGPMDLIDTVVPALDSEQVDYTVFRRSCRTNTVWAMILDRMYVVANEFVAERSDSGSETAP